MAFFYYERLYMIELLNSIFKLCIVPLLGVLTVYLVNLIKKKSNELQEIADNELANKYIGILTEIVINCVIATNQTYVDGLKDKNAFDVEAQKNAFEMTYNAVMRLLTDEAIAVLEEAFGDISLLVTKMIETRVNYNKKEIETSTKIGF